MHFSRIVRSATRLGILLLLGAPGRQALAKCQLLEAAALHVTMDRNQPLVQGAVNGHPVMMLIDTGAEASAVLRSAAPGLGVVGRSVTGVRMFGVGGETRLEQAGLAELRIGEHEIRDPHLLVLGEHPVSLRSDVGVVIGRDYLSRFDIEFDLPERVIRLLIPQGCKGDQVVYWGAYSQAPLEPQNSETGPFVVNVLLDGARIQAVIDSGADLSVATLDAAMRAGVTPRSPGVRPLGALVGAGAYSAMAWAASFPTFQIGEEVIRNARIEISDLFARDRTVSTGSHIDRQIAGLSSMLLGADFLLSHRMLIAPGQRVAYFSYVGGEPFGRTTPNLAPVASGRQQAAANAAATK